AGISLLASRRFSLVRDVAVQTDAQIGAEASLAGLVRSQVALFERAREKALGQILPLFIVGIPLHANVLVDGFPIGSDDEVEGALASRGIVSAGGENGRAPRRREAARPASDVRLVAHGETIRQPAKLAAPRSVSWTDSAVSARRRRSRGFLDGKADQAAAFFSKSSSDIGRSGASLRFSSS